MEENQIPKNDDNAARREARRRKILENSKNRLTRITGREHTDEDDKKTGNIYAMNRFDENLFNSVLVNFQCR